MASATGKKNYLEVYEHEQSLMHNESLFKSAINASGTNTDVQLSLPLEESQKLHHLYLSEVTMKAFRV